MYDAKSAYDEYAKQAAFIKEGNNEPFAKESNNKLLPRMATGLGKTMSPLPQGQIG
jgi:hypothetical protein